MPVKIFFCYAHEDEELLNKLKAHLKPLQLQGVIDIWHDRDISAGTDWEQQIKEQLNTAQIILLLVSPDFMASDYSYSIEMQRAIERHDRGEARVIPVILRHVYWQGVLGKLQALPTDAKPIKSWSDVDEALYNVTEGIRKVVEEQTRKSNEQRAASYVTKLDYPYYNVGKPQIQRGGMGVLAQEDKKELEKDLVVSEEAIRLDPNLPDAHYSKGMILIELGRYEKARYEEALAAFEEAIRLKPNYADAYAGKGYALNQLEKLNEGQAAYQRAREFGYRDS